MSAEEEERGWTHRVRFCIKYKSQQRCSPLGGRVDDKLAQRQVQQRARRDNEPAKVLAPVRGMSAVSGGGGGGTTRRNQTSQQSNGPAAEVAAGEEGMVKSDLELLLEHTHDRTLSADGSDEQMR
jgi:hypothetical protein